ncbi:Fic family protein [Luteipulveratus halotolerans]|uniref:Cell filamentation protein Fic n=1 Tax=Luteipulveratus halotolerans TaxID=1631356 RepID=A0A0L6CKE1_9MICO|nr:Fic family protein [Luteipulveratus halotolerans]KNX38271.1 cell filamentation protein Fic [Luteipulveratus halotolerans]
MGRGRTSRVTVYARLDAAIAELEDRLGGLPSPRESEYVWSDIWHLEAHHSTALEGNTLVLREVEALLENGRAVGAKPLKEYMEVQGYGDAARWVYAQALNPGDWHNGDLISVAEVCEIHRIAMSPVWQVAPHPEATDREAPGRYREHEIAAFDGGMTPPTWPLIPSMLSDWVGKVKEHTDELRRARESDTPFAELLASLHNEFECIHPFIDGNGRTGRLVLNLILVRLGYPPVIVLKTQRPAYLSAMAKSDQGDHGPLGEILARAMYDNLNRFIVPAVAGPARLVPLAALADDDFTVNALRQAATRGRLEAVQGADGVWRTSRRAVQAYARTRGRHRAGEGS